MAIVRDTEEEDEQSCRTSEVQLFSEEAEALDCLLRLYSPDYPTRSKSLERLRSIFDKYLECPTLLDPYIERLVRTCTENIQKDLRRSIHISEIQHGLSALYQLCKVRGRKCVQMFLPHTVDDVQPVWKMLESLIKETEIETAIEEHVAMPPLWESQYVLWNWMSVLGLLPFHATLLLAREGFRGEFLVVCKQQMSEPGPIREAAAACLANWLSRPDWEAEVLSEFVDWSRTALISFHDDTNNSNSFQILGILQTLVSILKVGLIDRELLIKQFSCLQETILQISDRSHNVLVQKMLIKWWTRMSCTYLPPRVATWRYQRGKRSLLDNIQRLDELIEQVPSTAGSNRHVENETIWDVPDNVEDSMGRLIEDLAHSCTTVRWSAAKGIGRITERLPAVCADDVVDHIVEYFHDVEKDKCWHGACLALAELARRGLLLPRRLGDVVPFVIRAIQYDLRRGQSSVGAHVRDAACYCYWAFTRAYSSTAIGPHLSRLNVAVVLTSLFDREVNCRRAASAAFQEAVGRQGALRVPHGISILTTADYFSLGNRTHAYTRIAYEVTKFEVYRMHIVNHLCSEKLFHWDEKIRTLASESLSILTPLVQEYMATDVLPLLLEKALDPKDIHIRHGAVLGVAGIVLALHKNRKVNSLSDRTLQALVSLVPAIEKKRLYRGRGGELVRSAVCRLVECMSLARIPLDVKEQVQHLDSIDASIPHPSEAIQQNACRAAGCLLSTYFPVREKGPSQRLQARVVDKFVKQVRTSDNPAATRGYALALGHLPQKLLSPTSDTVDSVVACLCKAAHYSSLVGGEPDAETRRNALFSLASVAETVLSPKDAEAEYPCERLSFSQATCILGAFFEGLHDYKGDRRGDVGSWCRMASMEGTCNFVNMLAKVPDLKPIINESLMARFVGGILKQLAEKLDVVRVCAGRCLVRLVFSEESCKLPIPQKDRLIESFELVPDNYATFDETWSTPELVFPRILKVAALGVDEYFDNVIAGIVLSIGGLTEHIKKCSFNALQISVRLEDKGFRDRVGSRILSVMEAHRGSARVVLPVLKTLVLILRYRCLGNAVDGSFIEKCQNNIEMEESSCTDIHRLLSLIDVATEICATVPTGAKRQLAFLCKMLAHRYPRIRKHACVSLYQIVTENTDNPPNNLVAETLSCTSWASENAGENASSIRTIVDELDVRDLYESMTKDTFRVE